MTHKEIKKNTTSASDNISSEEVGLIQIAIRNIHQMSPIEKMEMVRFGVSKQFLEKFKITASLDYDVLAKALSVTRATLINKQGVEKFNAQISAAIIALADIYSYGYEVFKDEDRFNKWMSKPNQALDGQAPYDFLDNQYGRDEVKNIIGRIDYGVYS